MHKSKLRRLLGVVLAVAMIAGGATLLVPFGAMGSSAPPVAGSHAPSPLGVFAGSTPTLSLSPASGPPGTLVTLTGSSYAGSTTYNYCWAPSSSRVGCPGTLAFKTSAGGAIPSGTTLSYSGSGRYAAVSLGTTSSGFVLSKAFTATTATLTLTPSDGPTGTLVGLSGSGYAPSTTYDVCWASSSSATGCPSTVTIVSTGAGVLQAGAAITFSGSGTYVAISQGSAPANFVVSAVFGWTTASLSLSPSTGPRGTLVTVTGSQFAPSTVYDYCWASSRAAVGCPSSSTFTSTGAGGLPSGMQVTYPGSEAALAVSQGSSPSNFIISAAFTGTTATLTLKPSSGPSGTQVGLSGSGYGPATTYDVCWTASSSAVGCASTVTFVATSAGAIPASAWIEYSGSGGHVAVSQGSSPSNFIISAAFKSTTATLSLSPSTGPTGTLVTLSGSGFAPSTVYDYCWTTSSAAVGCPASFTFTTTSAGALPSGVQVTYPGSEKALAVSQGSSASNFIVSAAFTSTTATLSLSPSSGSSGTKVTLSGSGFAPSTVYDYCWVSSPSSGCSSPSTFKSTGSGAIPSSVTITWSGGACWLAIYQGTSTSNYIVEAYF
jgi:hypothetical protein